MGDIAIMAETEIEGMIVSEPYNVWDTLFYDNAIGSLSENWDNYSNRLIITSDDEGTLLTNNTSYYGYIFANNPNVPSGDGTNIYEFNYPLAIELDIVNVKIASDWGIDWTKSGDHRWNGNEMNLPLSGHIKIIYDGSTVKTYANGSTTESATLNFTQYSDFGLGIYVRTGTTFKFKNFKIYSI